MRTVAVYLVVLFHSGVEPASGGFIGVDLFFVLSGFLVCGVLLSRQNADGRIDLWSFYVARTRRLLPAAITATVGTALLSLLVAPRTGPSCG